MSLAGLSATTFAATEAAGPKARAPRRTFNIDTVPSFADFRTVVEMYSRKHRPATANDFCLLGEIADDDSKQVWVIWKTGHRLILWESDDRDLESSRRNLDLRKDVVPSDDEIHGSTYRVSRAWVDDLTASCERAGTKVHIEKRRGAASKQSNPEHRGKANGDCASEQGHG